MQNTRLIQFLKSLSKSELRQFRDFVNSPVFNKNNQLITLHDILQSYYPDFDNPDLTEEKLYRAVFKNDKFNYSKIKNLISDLFGLGKEFLQFIIYNKDQNYKERLLLQELRNRNLDVSFEQAFKFSFNRLEKSETKDENYYLHKMHIRTELMNFHVPKKPNMNFHFQQERLDLFLNYALITLLKMYDLMLHESNQNNYNFDLKMFDNVMSYLKNLEIKDNPVLEMYYCAVLLEKTKDEKYFYRLRDLLFKYKNELNVYDRYMIYIHLDGFCATAYNEHCRTDLLKDQFLLSKEFSVVVNPEIKKILYPDFLNEVKKAVRVNEFEWAEKYIENYSDKLTEEKVNTLNFCYGYISYKKGELDKALDYFSKANFSNFILKIQVKILLLQIYIDMKYYEQAILMIDAFRHYLSREKSILDSIKTSSLEFLRLSGELIKLNTSVSDKDKDFKRSKIREDIEKLINNRFGIKLWLREKIVNS